MGESLLPGDPRQLGRFYLDGRLGSGGQGVVYEGYGTDGQRVAVKVLLAVDAEDRERLRREVQAWRKVEPYCTTRVLEADLDASVPYVVSEYVAGPDLRRAVNSTGVYGPEELRRLAVNLATALVAIHRAGVVHRDLKPENILIGPDGPRVIDFGIARILEGTATTGLPMGTLRYMPPERYRGAPGDGTVDVWGWAAVVLFAATGRDAFEGNSVAAVAQQVATHEPDVSGLAEPLRSLVARALAKDPKARPGAEQLLLSLVGRSDLADAVRDAAPQGPPQDAVPSRAEIAEATFAALDPQEQDAVPSMLLRLVAPGERAEDTLRSARLDELPHEGFGHRALAAFTDAGVLAWDGDRVTLATAALLRSWPRLRDWVEGERAGLAVHQRLAEASRIWSEHGRKRNDLLQGTPLEQARDWAATGRRHLVLNRTERDFLEAGAALGRRRDRLRVAVSLGLSLLLVLTASAAGVAYAQWHTVLGQKHTLAEQRRTLVVQLDHATSIQVADLAQSMRTSDPRLAGRLAVAAQRLDDTSQARSAEMTLDHQPEADVFKPPPLSATPLDLDGTGRLFVRAEGTRVEVWDVRAHRQTATYTAPAPVHDVTVSDDGSRAALSGDDGQVRILDLAHGTLAPGTAPVPVSRSYNGYWPDTTLSPRGNYLVVSAWQEGHRQTLEVWDTHDGRSVVSRADLSGDLDFPASRTTFSLDEGIMSLPLPNGNSPFTWYSMPDRKPLPSPDLKIPADDLKGSRVAFSPDHSTMAVQDGHGKIVLYDSGFTYLGTLNGASEFGITPVHFSHGGNLLVQRTTVWNLKSRNSGGNPVFSRPTTSTECNSLTNYRFTADDNALVCVGSDLAVRTLDIGAVVRPAEPGPSTYTSYSDAAVSGDRTTLALLDNVDNRITVWSLQGPRQLLTMDGIADNTNYLVLSRDGHLLAARQRDQVSVWDLGKQGGPGAPVSFPLQLPVAGSAFSFSPDGTSLAVAEAPPKGPAALTFWNLADAKPIRSIRSEIDYQDIWLGVFFQPDGKSVTVTPNVGTFAFPGGQPLSSGKVSDLSAHAISDDGTTLYGYPGVSQTYLRLWNARTLQQAGDDLNTGNASSASSSNGMRGAVSADGRLFVSARESGANQQIQVWDVRSRTPLGAPLTGPAHEISALAFSPDGSRLTAVDETGGFYTYDLSPDRLTADLCGRAGELTEAEWKEYIPAVPYRRSCP